MPVTRLLPVAILLLAVAAPAASAAAQEATACAPPSAVSGSAMPGGDATLSVAQPGPAPAGLPAICWIGGTDGLQNVPGPMVVGDAVVTATIDGDVEALRITDGAEAWRTRVDTSGGGEVGGITVDDATLYAGSPQGLRALDAATGAERWLFPVEGGPLTGMGGITPVVSGDLLVMALFTSSWDDVTADFTIDRSLVTLSSGTGAERWRIPLFADERPGSPTTDGRLVAIADGDGRLRVLDATTGADLWQLDPDSLGSAPGTRIAIAGDRLVAGLHNGDIVALDAADGSVIWRTASSSFLVGALTVIDGVVYVNGTTQLQALDLVTGAIRWDVPIQLGAPPIAFQAVPAVVDGQVILGTTELYDAASLVSFDAADGAERWRFRSQDLGAILSPVVAGGRVFASAFGLSWSGGSGGLIAFGATE